MADKYLNLFDACAAKCVHLPLQEEKCITSSWGDRGTMYTPGTIANSKRTSEINKNQAIAKVRILVEQVIMWNIYGHLDKFQMKY